MKEIDYKIFVPRGKNNYVRFNSDKEFEINDILTINIHLGDDKVTYWFYIKIPEDDEYHKLLLKKGKKLQLILLIGNNPYEIIGVAEVIEIMSNRQTQMNGIKVCFSVTNASNTINNPRKEVDGNRFEMLDIRDD